MREKSLKAESFPKNVTANHLGSEGLNVDVWNCKLGAWVVGVTGVIGEQAWSGEGVMKTETE